MPRPKKDVVEYFSHSVNSQSEKAVKVLRHKFGNDGYVAWFVLKEALGRSEGHYLDLRLQDDIDLCAIDCGVDEDRLDAILSCMAERSYINLDLWVKRIVWMPEFVRDLQPVYDKRGRPAPAAPTIDDDNSGGKPPMPSIPDTETTEGEEIGGQGDDSGTETTQSIVEQSIVKDSKEKDAGGVPPGKAKMSEEEYKLLIDTYFTDIEKELIVLKRWGEEYPHVEIVYELGKAKKWLLKNITNRKSDIGGWVEDVWLSGAEDRLRPKVDEKLPEGVPSYATFLLEVRAYNESVSKTGMYDKSKMCDFSWKVYDRLFGGNETYNATGPGYLNKALEAAYQMGVDLKKDDKKGFNDDW